MGMKIVGVLPLAPERLAPGKELTDSGLRRRGGIDLPEAVDRGRRLIAEGADIVEVCNEGGEGFALLDAPAVASPDVLNSCSEQVLEVISVLSREAQISIAASSAEAALSAVEAGASIIRDSSAALLETASLCGAGWVATHSGSGRESPGSGDTVGEVCGYMCELAEQASRSGIAEFYFDPGFGVGKSFEESFDLLAGLEVLTEKCSSVLLDVSPGAFVGALLGRLSKLPPTSEVPSPEGAFPQAGRGELDAPDGGVDAALAMAAWAAAAGVAALRCREVADIVDVARTLGVKPPAPPPPPARMAPSGSSASASAAPPNALASSTSQRSPSLPLARSVSAAPAARPAASASLLGSADG